jgi:hypothetical protein
MKMYSAYQSSMYMYLVVHQANAYLVDVLGATRTPLPRDSSRELSAITLCPDVIQIHNDDEITNAEPSWEIRMK